MRTDKVGNKWNIFIHLPNGDTYKSEFSFDTEAEADAAAIEFYPKYLALLTSIGVVVHPDA
jgi:hypothetical protein